MDQSLLSKSKKTSGETPLVISGPRDLPRSVSSKIVTICLQLKPFNITMLNDYATDRTKTMIKLRNSTLSYKKTIITIQDDWKTKEVSDANEVWRDLCDLHCTNDMRLREFSADSMQHGAC